MKRFLIALAACLWALSLLTATLHSDVSVGSALVAVACICFVIVGVTASVAPDATPEIGAAIIVVFGAAAQWFAWVPA